MNLYFIRSILQFIFLLKYFSRKFSFFSYTQLVAYGSLHSFHYVSALVCARFDCQVVDARGYAAAQVAHLSIAEGRAECDTDE